MHLLAVVALLPLALAACAPDAGAFYRDHARAMQAAGGLRTEIAPADAPFSNADLARNFEIIALNREYTRDAGTLVARRTASPLSRWEGPVRYRLIGNGVTAEDRNAYADLAARTAALTGRQIVEVERDHNLPILILGAEERAVFATTLRADGLAERWPILTAWTTALRYPCVGQVAFDKAPGGAIIGGIIAVKAELVGAFRRSCIEEEFVQTLGLLNDDDAVRPSIFNDDQEFALMTAHDAYLLQILYDPRLSPGMSADQARPLLRGIIDDIRPGMAGDLTEGEG